MKEEKMKILFYGAGVMGSLYAARLKDSGQDISVLARERLYTYTDPDVQPVADGSARIAINWHGVGIIVLSALVVLIVVLLIL